MKISPTISRFIKQYLLCMRQTFVGAEQADSSRGKAAEYRYSRMTDSITDTHLRYRQRQMYNRLTDSYKGANARYRLNSRQRQLKLKMQGPAGSCNLAS